MDHQEQRASRPGLPRFVRVVGAIWLVVVLALLLGALLAPHIGRLADLLLHHTSHREWIRMRLQTDEPFFNLSTPVQSIKSYYSALYRSDLARMEHVTEEPLRQHMRQRLRHGETATAGTTYHSYRYTEEYGADHAVVVEKFHLFWQRGLRFYLQRHVTAWRIVRVALLP
jgi:hypothetical protein